MNSVKRLLNLLLICRPGRVASWVGYSGQREEWTESSPTSMGTTQWFSLLKADAVYDVWNSHTWNQTRGIWSESKSIIHYNIKPRVSKCEWITYSRLLRVDQVAPVASRDLRERSGHMASLYWGSGGFAPVGSRGKVPGQGIRGRSPLELTNF